MKVQEYLENLIKTIPEYTISIEEKKVIQFEGVESYIYKKLSSSKFRASKVPKDLARQIRQKIKYCVENKLPIHISVPFGGFKKWQLPTHPNIDWAEVFNIIQLRDYLSPVAKAYEHGVLLDYFSDEIFISRMNNMPQSDLDLYNDSFKTLLEFFQKYFPSNIKLEFSKIRDQISQEEILKRFDRSIIKLRKDWNNLPEEERINRIKKSERNYKFDFSKVNEDEKQKILFESTLVHDAFIFGDWEEGVPWAFDIDMIPLGFRYTKSWGIHVKSSKSSTVQFWVGIGVLKETIDSFIPTILTYNQYLRYKGCLETEKVDVLKGFKSLKFIPRLGFARNRCSGFE